MTSANRGRSQRNLQGIGEFLVLDWSSAHQRESLATILLATHAHGHEAASWYFRRRKGLKGGVWMTRIVAVVGAVAAGIIPILASLKGTDGKPTFGIDPAWASVAVALGAAALWFDKYTGMTSRWVRYMNTGMRLVVENDQMAIQAQHLLARFDGACGDPRPTVCAAIEVCVQYVKRVDEVVAQETKEWGAEFLDGLRQLETSLNTYRDAQKTGAIEVQVSSADPLVDGRWSLSIDGGPPTEERGSTAVRTGLAPGTYHLRISAKTANGEVRGEAAAILGAGGKVSVPVTLS